MFWSKLWFGDPATDSDKSARNSPFLQVTRCKVYEYCPLQISYSWFTSACSDNLTQNWTNSLFRSNIWIQRKSLRLFFFFGLFFMIKFPFKRLMHFCNCCLTEAVHRKAFSSAACALSHSPAPRNLKINQTISSGLAHSGECAPYHYARPNVKDTLTHSTAENYTCVICSAIELRQRCLGELMGIEHALPR